MTGEELRDQLRALGKDDLVAILVMLCSGAYPRAAADSVLTELAKRKA